MNTDFTERLKREEKIQKGFWSFKNKVGAIAATIILLIAFLINTTGCTQKQSANDSFEPSLTKELSKENIKVGDDGVNAAIAPDNDDVAIVSGLNKNNKAEETEDISTGTAMVAMSIEDSGRSDPFLPYNEKVVVKAKPKFSYDLLPPPETITVDTSAQEVVGTKVSGIMYDRYNPSAIINISGSDYLVRSGDTINGYKVLSITKDTVTVQHSSNVYKAGVGELFAGNGVNFNTISNLEGKFGGYNNKNKK